MGKPSGDYAVIAKSGLFDTNHYLIEAPDVAADGCDPLLHFCQFGCREGRRPNLYFDPVWYADLYLGQGAEGVNALSHYIRIGERSGLRPVCYFDPAWYAGRYDLPARISPLKHYLTHRRSQAYAPNSLFDLDDYLRRYGAEIGPNRDAFVHLLRRGAGRNLDGSASFVSQSDRAEHGLPSGSDSPNLRVHEARIPLVHRLDQQARDDFRRRSARGPAWRWWSA